MKISALFVFLFFVEKLQATASTLSLTDQNLKLTD